MHHLIARPDQLPAGLPSAEPTVAEHLCTRVVRLPAWFTVTQALRVAELRQVSHILVEEHGRVRGSLSPRDLRAAAPRTDSLARWVRRSDRVISPDASIMTARKLMREQGLTCLPVVSRGMLVGTVGLTDGCDDEVDDDLRAT